MPDHDAQAIIREIDSFFSGRTELMEKWINSKVPALGNKTPYELMGTEEGRVALRKALGAISDGNLT